MVYQYEKYDKEKINNIVEEVIGDALNPFQKTNIKYILGRSMDRDNSPEMIATETCRYLAVKYTYNIKHKAFMQEQSVSDEMINTLKEKIIETLKK